jgi:hypothetical protein
MKIFEVSQKTACLFICLAALSTVQGNDKPWHGAVENFTPPQPGEHPRLLFRRTELPALKEKAKTPEGKAILKRLRLLLDGKDGQTMTTLFRAPDKTPQEAGVYSISHAAGYGLLYQLTGDAKYAEFGRQCFDKALAGIPDRDGRYGFRKPGGPLRAGPSVGWYAVGYDLCYDGWDEATRKKFGLAIARYAEQSSSKRENIESNLEMLARGDRFLGPHFRRNRGSHPGSNHFGMQVGGATLALLAITGEPWVDQQRVDKLLGIAEQSIVRNLTEGFGDGGFFAEGDGTGSMSSQIAFLSAISALGNVLGKDYVNVERPNVRMLTLKWIYQTVTREGIPDFWPVRGSYRQNVWSRKGLSGAGYFAIGMGAVPERHRSAMKWYYNRFLAEADLATQPFDTASWYPHLAVSAFVNWPVNLKPVNPAEVLPLCYRDSKWGFYLWRNRWDNDNDTVISLLVNRTEGFGGYLYSEPDSKLHINSMGRHLQWGKSVPGPVSHWWTSPEGKLSSMTLSDGTCIAVDFSGTSGVDVLLMTTAQAEGTTVKINNTPVTFFSPTSAEVPEINVAGNKAVIGRQQVSIKNANLVIAPRD